MTTTIKAAIAALVIGSAAVFYINEVQNAEIRGRKQGQDQGYKFGYNAAKDEQDKKDWAQQSLAIDQAIARTVVPLTPEPKPAFNLMRLVDYEGGVLLLKRESFMLRAIEPVIKEPKLARVKYLMFGGGRFNGPEDDVIVLGVPPDEAVTVISNALHHPN